MNSGRWLELRYGQTNVVKMKNKNKYPVLIVAILSLTGCWTRQGGNRQRNGAADAYGQPEESSNRGYGPDEGTNQRAFAQWEGGI